MDRHLRASVGTLIILALMAPSAVTAAPRTQWDPRAGILIDGATVVTMDDHHTVIPGAKVLVRLGKISAIWTRKAPTGVVVGDAMVVKAGANDLLFPGLINLHNHPRFDHVFTWPAPTSHIGPVPYPNRYEWGGGGIAENQPPEYVRLVRTPTSILSAGWGLDLEGELNKYAEVAALLGGTTSIQGGSQEPEVSKSLIRNVEDPDAFGGFTQESWVPPIAQLVADPVGPPVVDPIDKILDGMADGSIEAWTIHLAEGTDAASRAEFGVLQENNLLTDATVIIHGTALERSDFRAMREAPAAFEAGDGLGAKLVWSPLSNLLLYGATANVYEAMAEDVLVSLGTDWTPSGSRTILDELKIADIALHDRTLLASSRELVPEFGVEGKDSLGQAHAEAALDRAMVDMVTRNPALTLRWYDQVGSIEPGKVADLVLVHRPSALLGLAPTAVYRELINATERDVRLVLVGGDPLAGDVDVMHKLKGRDTEIVASPAGGFEKAVDVTTSTPGVPEGTEKLAQFTAEIAAGLAALGGQPDQTGQMTYPYLQAHLDGGNLSPDELHDYLVANDVPELPDGSLDMEAVQLLPLFAADNDFLGHILRADVDPAGLIADPTPPFTLYPANFNQVQPLGNPFASFSEIGP